MNRFFLTGSIIGLLLSCGVELRNSSKLHWQPVYASDPPTIEFTKYHSQFEINQYLRDVADYLPDYINYTTLGESAQGREMAYLELNFSGNQTSPVIFANGTHHGNEKSATETTLGLIDHLIRQQSSAKVQQILATYRIVVLPLVNPDGHARSSRYDESGRDPNRDYSYPERPDESSFRSPEITLIKGLQDTYQFRAALAYHSGMTGVLWPWCYSGERSDDHDIFYTLSKRSAEAMNFRTYTQSYYDYQTRGEYIDYAYMKHGTYAVTVEVSDSATPRPWQLPAVVSRAVTGTVEYMHGVFELDSHSLIIERERRIHLDPLRPKWDESTGRLE